MRKSTILTALAAVLAGCAALTVVTTSANADDDRKHRLSVVVKDTQATLTPADFFSALAPGAEAVVDAPVERSGQAVGSALTEVVVVRAGESDLAALITCSVELPEGNLLFAGSAHFAEIGDGVDLPVVGGTGRYRDASGVVTMKGLPSGDTLLTFRL